MRKRYLVELKDEPSDATCVKDWLEILVQKEYNKTRKQARNWCKKNNPILVVKSKHFLHECVFGYSEGYHGDQLLFFFS